LGSVDTRNRRPATTGLLTVTIDTVLDAPHNGNIIIAANNVALDCNGHTITGRIDVAEDDTTVKDCNVSFEDQGIQIHGARTTLEGNTASGIGIFSSDNTIIDTVSIGHKFDGFLVQGGGGSFLKGNRAEGNVVGFSLESTDNNLLSGNTAANNSSGFEIAGGSSGNALTGNSATNNSENGFSDDLTGAPVNTYENNLCAGNPVPSSPGGLC
jgi:parallel beta-helix repeat protein